MDEQSISSPAVGEKTNVERAALRRSRNEALNRIAKAGAAASLAVSLVSLAFGKKRVHAVAGGLFVGFLGVHLVTHRRRLFK